MRFFIIVLVAFFISCSPKNNTRTGPGIPKESLIDGPKTEHMKTMIRFAHIGLINALESEKEGLIRIISVDTVCMYNDTNYVVRYVETK